MLKERILRLVLPALIVISLLAGSCKDDIGTLGLNILPREDLFTGIDSVSFLSAQNVNPVYLRSNDPDYGIIGSVNDKFAGHTSASIITQLTLSNAIEQFNIDEDYVVDSLVLSLAYSRNWWFGNKDDQFNLKVYKFLSPLSLDEDYNSNLPVEGLFDPNPIGEKVSSPWDSQPDSIWDQTNYTHLWRIKLDEATTNAFFNLSEEELNSSNAFKDAFPGLMITADPLQPEQDGSLVTIDLLNTYSNVSLYYHYYTRDENDAIEDTVETGYIFPINRECVRINRFEHDAQGLIDYTNSKPNKLVAQGMAGSFVKFDLRKSEGGPIDFENWQEQLDPDAEDLYHGISAVDLFFKVDTTSQYNDTTFYSPIPESLTIYTINEEGQLEEPSYTTGVASAPTQNWFQGGTYNPETQEYQFRMTLEYFELLIAGTQVSQGPFVLASPNPVSDTRRVILVNSDSDSDSEPTPRIEIKYVTFKKP